MHHDDTEAQACFHPHARGAETRRARLSAFSSRAPLMAHTAWPLSPTVRCAWPTSFLSTLTRPRLLSIQSGVAMNIPQEQRSQRDVPYRDMIVMGK